jgi:serine/threonine-protein kinase
MTHPAEIQKYKIIRLLGSGNYGQVYFVLDRALNANKAIKVLKTNNPNRFLSSLEEAQILNRCKHKHIVTINEANIFLVNGKPRVILDLEYIPNGSLEDAMKKRWISIHDAVTYMRGALLGLQHAHEQGFLHRDIKPGNILLKGKTAKLSDFGLATDPGAKLIGSARGYRTHLPPEYYKNKNTSVLTDIYAAGMTLFRIVSNITVWRSMAQTIPSATMHIQKGTLIKKIGFAEFIPAPLKRIINKSCNPNPLKRYQTALSFCQQLDRLRFDIDWNKHSDFEWRGKSKKGSHVCAIDIRKNSLTVLKNNRRVQRDCGRYTNTDEAISAMNNYIANSSIEDVV